jgi:hypothetical protein
MKTICINKNTGPKPILPVNYLSTEELQLEVKNKLFGGIAHFLFTKKSDGSIREVFGTLNNNFHPIRC